jgi:hypothetical protein
MKPAQTSARRRAPTRFNSLSAFLDRDEDGALLTSVEGARRSHRTLKVFERLRRRHPFLLMPQAGDVFALGSTLQPRRQMGHLHGRPSNA